MYNYILSVWGLIASLRIWQIQVIVPSRLRKRAREVNLIKVKQIVNAVNRATGNSPTEV